MGKAGVVVAGLEAGRRVWWLLIVKGLLWWLMGEKWRWGCRRGEGKGREAKEEKVVTWGKNQQWAAVVAASRKGNKNGGRLKGSGEEPMRVG